jgi:hypothetical protein
LKEKNSRATPVTPVFTRSGVCRRRRVEEPGKIDRELSLPYRPSGNFFRSKQKKIAVRAGRRRKKSRLAETFA